MHTVNAHLTRSLLTRRGLLYVWGPGGLFCLSNGYTLDSENAQVEFDQLLSHPVAEVWLLSMRDYHVIFTKEEGGQEYLLAGEDAIPMVVSPEAPYESVSPDDTPPGQRNAFGIKLEPLSNGATRISLEVPLNLEELFRVHEEKRMRMARELERSPTEILPREDKENEDP